MTVIDNISLLGGSRHEENDASVSRPSTPLSKNTTSMKLQQLEQIMIDNISENKPLVFIHPGLERDSYEDEEIESMKIRDFQTRIFMSSLALNMNSVWLRNHHSDNFTSKSNFTYVRDYFKAAFTTKNHTAAKATLTAELTKWFDLEHHEYYTYATTLASAMSNEATNTSFQIHQALVRSADEIRLARRTFILLMDILFSKVYVKTFLHKENNSNIYRLVHCVTKNTKSFSSLSYAIFSFLLQVALTSFVVLQLTTTRSLEESLYVEKNAMFVLASLGGIYSVMITNKEYRIARDVYRFYGRIGPLQLMDATVNLVLPLILLVAGFIVTIQESTYIAAVLNTAAFLFIPEIDDQVPALLGYDEEAIIENYLIAESKVHYNRFTSQQNEDINNTFKNLPKDSPLGVPFNDYYITNCAEQGSSPHDGTLYQPHIVVKNEVCGHEIDPSNYVTKDCLVRRVEWCYTTYDPKTTKPRIGYLKLVKVDGEIVEIKYKGVEAMKVGERHSVDGVFVITNFVMSSAILKLRFCGSDSAKNFVKAFEYYSLWEIDYQSRNLLSKYEYTTSKSSTAKKGHSDIMKVSSTFENPEEV